MRVRGWEDERVRGWEMEGERVGDGKVRGWRVRGWEDERVGGLEGGGCVCVTVATCTRNQGVSRLAKKRDGMNQELMNSGTHNLTG